MELLVFIIGFACFGGLLAGFAVARLCPRRMLWTLWAVGIAAGGITAMMPQWQYETGGLLGTIILFGAILPFTVCAIIAGLIGLVARRVAEPAA